MRLLSGLSVPGSPHHVVVKDAGQLEVSQADTSFELVTTELGGADKNDTGTMDATLADEVFP